MDDRKAERLRNLHRSLNQELHVEGGIYVPEEEIEELCEQFISQLSPLKVYLFGSFADGTGKKTSELDFYIVMRDGTGNLADLTTQAYRSIRRVKRRPVDIIVGTESRFGERCSMPTIESEVARKGVLLYGESI